MERVALVTGATRGIGFEVCRKLGLAGYRILMTGIDASEGEAAVASLSGVVPEIRFFAMDVTEERQIDGVGAILQRDYGRLDVLVNNAAISPYLGLERYDIENSVLEGRMEFLQSTFDTNTLGAIRVCRRFVPFMIDRGYGRVVNVTSGSGQLSGMESGWPGYRISKAGLNAFTRILAAELKGLDILVNSVCPGQARTKLGGADAPLSPDEAADSIVWAATLESGGPTGGFFRDGERIPW